MRDGCRSRMRHWWAGWLMLSLATVCCLSTDWALPTVVVAQEEKAADGANVTKSEPVAPKPKQNLLVWLYNALTLRYVIAFLLISFMFVSFIVMNLLSIRRDNICPPHLIEGFEAHLNEKRFQEAYELAKNDDSFLGMVLSAGLQRLSQGYSHAIEAMQEVGEDETMKLEHRLSYIAMVGSIAPMVGLLGTVDGMVVSFSKIAESDRTPKPAVLAEGISMALVTTLVGLILAIPAVMFFGFMKNRLARLTLEVGIASERLMSRFDVKK